MSESGASPTSRWAGAWPDALAFAAGLGLAWGFGWNTTDLVWSLWLSSLVVGYAMIVWGIFMPAALQFREGDAAAGCLKAVGGIFLLAFFTFHFGLFHLAHAAFLNAFFPIDLKNAFPGPGLLVETVVRYGLFLPVAVVAERRGFFLPQLPAEPPVTSVRAVDIAARKARQALGATNLILPYRNVIRMHVLIFFFAFAHFARWDSFAVYAVVYAVYFFPWRLVFGRSEGTVRQRQALE